MNDIARLKVDGTSPPPVLNGHFRPSCASHLPEARRAVCGFRRNLEVVLAPPAALGAVESGAVEHATIALWYLPILEDGDLIWLSSEIVALASHAGRSLPMDTTLHPEMIPFIKACAFFTTATEFFPLVAPADLITWHLDGETLRLAIYEWGSVPLPNTELSWHVGQRLDEVAGAYDGEDFHYGPDAYRRYRFELLRSFVSLLLLMSQGGIVEEHEERISRPVARRLARVSAAVPKVRVIYLRGSGSTGDGTGHHLTKRFIVRGHWRNQAFGPSMTLRRPTWIAPHVKGPEGAPLDTRPSVRVI